MKLTPTQLRRIIIEEAASTDLSAALGRALGAALRDKLLDRRNDLTLAVGEELGDTGGFTRPRYDDIERIAGAAVTAALDDPELRSALVDVAATAVLTSF